MKGAEAVLEKITFLGVSAVEKFRVEKEYRAPALDRQIRSGRTKREARLLARAKEAGVLCPAVLSVGEFYIRMKFLEGEMLYHTLRKRKISAKEMSDAAEILVKLHSKGIIHGDYTPANLMKTNDGMAVIDFGLGSISPDAEDKATDIVMMKKALGTADGTKFVSAYSKAGGARGVVKMVSEIENRARYMERG
ncbi:MAG: KEOPS complex kinase/ATPase Bud32 [Candidatus Micrarchaeia archaeon]